MPFAFRRNITVEINAPDIGADLDLQGAFATDAAGGRWIMHQGRMSVAKARVAEADFIAATGLKPVPVRFRDGSESPFHPVAPLDRDNREMQKAMAGFIANCAIARMAKKAPVSLVNALASVVAWENTLKPEATGAFETGPRGPITVQRHHAEVWRALSRELTRRKLPHTNARVARYGPDLFTYAAPEILFEIKSAASAQDIMTGVGQLQVYERLLKRSFRKVLVIPKGMRAPMMDAVTSLKLVVVEYDRTGRTIRFDKAQLDACVGKNWDAAMAS